MGFLRFLGRKEERKVDDELDVPPPPPSSMGMSSIDSDLNAPFPGDELTSSLSFPKQDSKQQMSQSKGLPSMDDFDFDAPSSRVEMSRPMPEMNMQMPRPAPSQIQPSSFGTMQRPIIPPDMPAPNAPEQFGRSLYVEVEQFRNMMADLAKTRTDLKRMETVMEHMLVTEANRDKDYAKYRAILNDTQRKLVFIDKTLFKGDAP